MGRRATRIHTSQVGPDVGEVASSAAGGPPVAPDLGRVGRRGDAFRRDTHEGRAQGVGQGERRSFQVPTGAPGIIDKSVMNEGEYEVWAAKATGYEAKSWIDRVRKARDDVDKHRVQHWRLPLMEHQWAGIRRIPRDPYALEVTPAGGLAGRVPPGTQPTIHPGIAE